MEERELEKGFKRREVVVARWGDCGEGCAMIDD